MLNIYEFVKIKGIESLYMQIHHRNIQILFVFTLKKKFFFNLNYDQIYSMSFFKMLIQNLRA